MEVLQSYIDIQVVAFCLLFGSYIKNTRLNNNVIPFLLTFIGVVISFMLKGFTSESILIGIYSAWVSTGIHSTGNGIKKLYKEK